MKTQMVISLLIKINKTSIKGISTHIHELEDNAILIKIPMTFLGGTNRKPHLKTHSILGNPG